MSPKALKRCIQAQMAAISALVWLSLPVSAHPGTASSLHHYDHLISQAPNDPEPYMDRALLLIESGRLDAAARDLQTVDHIAPALNTGYLRGLLALRGNEPAVAVEHFNHFLAEYPTDSRSHEARARAFLALNEKPSALDDLVNAVRYRNTTDPGLVMETARLAHGLDQLPLGLQLIDEAMASAGLVPQLQLAAVDMLVHDAQYDKALARLQELIDQPGDNPEWQIRKAELLLAMDNPVEAAVQLDEAETEIETRKPTPWREHSLADIAKLRAVIATCAGRQSCPATTPK